MRFYFDNNLSPHLARAMSELAADEEGDEIVHARERDMDRMTDPEFIDILSREGKWVIVTTDVAMSRSPHLVQALASSGLVSVSLRHGWLELGGRRMASQLLRRWSEIRETAARARPSTVVVVPVRGRIVLHVLSGRANRKS